MTDTAPSTSDLLRKVKQHEGTVITLGALIAIFREGGFALLLILFASPLALPLPAVGIATVMSVPILFIAGQLAIGKRTPWLPEKLARKEIELDSLRKVINTILPWLEKIEHLIRPRITLFSTRIGCRLIGLVMMICACSVALPIPFSNTIPSMGIVLMSLGLLERDGVVILAGMVVGAIGVGITTAILYFGLEAVKSALF